MSNETTVTTFLGRVSTDPARVRDLLAPDLRWDLNGQEQTTTADDFVARQQADLATGTAVTEVETMVVGDDAVAVLGWTTFTPDDDGPAVRLRLAEVLTVADDRISRISDVMVPAPG